jgi:hypothetical protein
VFIRKVRGKIFLIEAQGWCIAIGMPHVLHHFGALGMARESNGAIRSVSGFTFDPEFMQAILHHFCRQKIKLFATKKTQWMFVQGTTKNWHGCCMKRKGRQRRLFKTTV